MIVSGAQMKALEERAFAEGVTAEALMEDAGTQIAAAVRQFFPLAGKCVVHFGKGNNGGDALVAARHLAAHAWRIELLPAFPEEDWSELLRKKHAEFAECPNASEEVQYFGPNPPPLVVLDGLLGLGATGPLRGRIRSSARAINALRSATDARVFAIDLPTGLHADTGAPDTVAVVADYTLTIGFAKAGLIADGAANWVGRVAVLPLHELSRRAEKSDGPTLATPASLARLLPRRHFDLHKGDCGRVGIVAGSRGMSGAAVMCAEAALHAGAGLVTLYVAPEIEGAVVARIVPEIMVKAITSLDAVRAARHDVLAIGPGLGRERDAEVLEFIEHAPEPMVIDADALNALATRIDVLGKAAGPRLLTPHPGEMQRLVPTIAPSSRRETVERFIRDYPVTLLLKGARTIVAAPGQPLSYNTTGSPGMATGGMGDVLTGVCAALIAQKLGPYDAARLGAWLCGRAAELALATDASEESLSATDVISQLGRAFHSVRAGDY